MSQADTSSKLTPSYNEPSATASIYSHSKERRPHISHTCSWQWAGFLTTRVH